MVTEILFRCHLGLNVFTNQDRIKRAVIERKGCVCMCVCVNSESIAIPYRCPRNINNKFNVTLSLFSSQIIIVFLGVSIFYILQRAQMNVIVNFPLRLPFVFFYMLLRQKKYTWKVAKHFCTSILSSYFFLQINP